MIATIENQREYIQTEYLLDFNKIDEDTTGDFVTAVGIYMHEGYTTTNAIRFSLRDLDITEYEEIK